MKKLTLNKKGARVAQSEKNKTQQTKQATDLKTSKRHLGTMQKDNQEQIRKLMLHMRSFRINREQLAHWALVGKSQSGCLFEIRPKSPKTAVLQMQHPSRGSRSGVLRKDGKGKRPGIHGPIRKRKTDYRESLRSLLKNLRRI